jgi:hypothetical protein
MATIFDTKLIELLPPAFKNIDEICWICESIQPEIDEVVEIIKNKLFFSDFEKLDDLALDYLLFEAGIGGSIENSFIKSRADKISFLRNYVKLNQLRGTKDGVLYAADMLGINAEVTEWFEIPEELKPYWFKIRINNEKVFTDNELSLIKAYINAYKNTRSWFKTEIRNTYYSEIYSLPVLRRRMTFKSNVEFITAIPSSIYSTAVTRNRMVLKGKFNDK